MDETRDRCGPAVRAYYRADRAGELYLCGHCANRLWPALWAHGWTIWLIREHALARLEGTALSGDRGTGVYLALP